MEVDNLTPDRRDSLADLDGLSIIEVLDQDSRPTFVIDLDPDEGITIGAKRVQPIFCNAALRLHERLLDSVFGRQDSSAIGCPPLGPDEVEIETKKYEDFSSWATSVTSFDNSNDIFPLSFVFRDLLWTGSTVRKRWRLISGSLLTAKSLASEGDVSPPPSKAVLEPRITESADSFSTATGSTLVSQKSAAKYGSSSKQTTASKLSVAGSESTGDRSQSLSSNTTTTTLHLATPEKAVVDWTVPHPQGVLSDHVKFARSVAWEHTPLGPMNKWSREFRQIVNLVMGNPYPAAIFWGSDLTMFYNEAYAIEVAGHKHPSLMGTGFSGPFSELWDSVAPIFAECARTGVSIRKDEDYLPIERFGFLEETFYSWSWTPLYGGTKKILGFYNAPFEVTQSVLRHRRWQTISKIGENLSGAKTMRQFWKLLIGSLEDNHFDVPFALLYSVGDSEDMDDISQSSESTMSFKTCHLEGAIGIPEGHPAAAKQLDLKRSPEGFIPAFREAMRTREPTLLHATNGSLPEELLEGIDWRGYGDPCNKALIFPVRPTEGENVLAFLLLGINPRRPYDDGYKSFTALLNRQMATSLASFMLYEEEVHRSRDLAEAAALEQEHLSKELAMQTSRLRRMTELSPLGMFLLTPDGVIREGNDRYFEMTGHPRDGFYEMSFMEQIEDSSKKAMKEGWHRLTVDRKPWSGELQLKKILVSPVDLNGEDIEYWIQVESQPELAADGSVRSVLGSITDISHWKWVQGLQERRLQEAEETRRQQNEFIDITSHEMRNPLSAILQCADDILSTLDTSSAAADGKIRSTPSMEDIQACLDAAQTILLCVQHQKSIVDDILTVSKLDSNLLVIAPTATQPLEVAKRALKMFEPEIQAKNIIMNYEVKPSIEKMGIDWLMLDPSRVLQILINLITNAIKFTAGASNRAITVSIDATDARPLNDTGPFFQYITPRMLDDNVVNQDEWGNGEVMYLHFSVSDTGVGLTPQEMLVLFERFSQASPRTHAQYGGSGLGLFISRQLAEVHGGQIGVASETTSGSTFGFYIATRRAEAPSASDNAPELPVGGGMTPPLVHPVGPQRQELASVQSSEAGLVASRAVHEIAAPLTNLEGLDILVVEDNLVNQNVLVKQLKKVGGRVNVANDGLEALAFLERTQFHVGSDDSATASGQKLSIILMDLEMPNMDGLTCVGRIRDMQAAGTIQGHVPVIAVTANVREEQVSAAMKSGMDDVVSKPFRIPDLMKKVGALLNRTAV